MIIKSFNYLRRKSMADINFDFKDFIEDAKNTLIKPKDYFSSLTKSGGFVDPIIRACIFSLIAGIIYFIWTLLKIGGSWGMSGQSMAGFGSIIVIFTTLLGGIIGLFIGGLIIMLISMICSGDTNYEANTRVTASLMVISPISAFLSFLNGINLYLGIIVSLLVGLYAIWLLYMALLNSLSAKENVAKIVCIVLAVLSILASLGSLLTPRAMM
jgi:hypothetical protein